MTYLPTQTSLPSAPVAAARELAELLLAHAKAGWRSEDLELVARMRTDHLGAPLVLAATEAALADDPATTVNQIRSVIDQIDDHGWAGDLAGDILGAPSVGVLSLGQETLAVLEALTLMSTVRIQLVAPSRAVARGLGYLRQPVLLGPPQHADTLLLPVTAYDPITLWTHRKWAASAWAALDTNRVVAPALHPLRLLSPLNRRVFRPPAGVVAMQRPHRP